MSMYICRFDHEGVRYYFNYSTVTKIPTTWAMTKDEYESYYRRKFGPDATRVLPDRLARADESGSSAKEGVGFERMIAGNKAGPQESRLSADEMIIALLQKRKEKVRIPQAGPAK